MIKIENGWLFDSEEKTIISHDATPNVSGSFREGLPDTIVIHYTAGVSLKSTVDWLKRPEAKASAHVVIGKRGEIIQLASFNVQTWHAGKSTWKERSGINQYSIGIEIDNAGLLNESQDGFKTCFNRKVEIENVIRATHKLENEIKAWEAYTKEQIEIVEEICWVLIVAYNISEIVGHDDIAPMRKRDPGPAFPMKSLQNKILNA